MANEESNGEKTWWWRHFPGLRLYHTLMAFFGEATASHSVEISEFCCLWDFTWNQFWQFFKYKICHFNTCRGLEFWFVWIWALFKSWNYQIDKIRSPKIAKNGSFSTSRFSNIDFTQNLSGRKIMKFAHCVTCRTQNGCRLLGWLIVDLQKQRSLP